ncbi:lysozyme c-1-like [Centruroides vittatus]|uniref:lysozyme c-1-like n=1 Tax=Centruroides vittatus TaxID=120091 RepID=UPI0035109732
MASQLSLFIIFAFSMIAIEEAKVFNRCEMATILVRNGFPRHEIPNWLCLIRHESNFNSRATNRNIDGSIDHGIFQINDRYWCSPPGPHNDCNVKCSNLLDDNIADDMRCARIIYRRHKFNAWYGWKNNCRGKNLQQYVNGCKY